MKSILSVIAIMVLGFGISIAQDGSKEVASKNVKQVKSVKAVNSTNGTMKMKAPVKEIQPIKEVETEKGSLQQSSKVNVTVDDAKKNTKVIVEKESKGKVETTTVKVKKKSKKVKIRKK